ncbi:MAG: PAS domain S-box protein [Candidatus Tectomicrobia bacterium]|nr:PAS domain S-box protein [Candidatus Tectomicrobia bacterium]
MDANLFLRIANFVPDPLVVLSAAGVVQAANQPFATILDLPLHDLAGQSLMAFLGTPEEDFRQYLRSCLRSPDIALGALDLQSVPGQKRRFRCEGGLLQPRTEDIPALVMLRLRPAELSGERFTALNEKIEALNREVSRRIEVEQTLRNSEARKSAMLETALDAIMTIDHEGRIVEFNPAAEAMFGYRSEEVIGQTMAELMIPPALRWPHQQAFRRYLDSGKGAIFGQRIELTAMRADGSDFPVELAVAPIADGSHPMFTAYIRDITERKANLSAVQDQLRLAAFGRDVGLALSRANSMREMVQQCAWLVVQHLGGAFARIWSVNERDRVLELQASAGLYTDLDGDHSRIPMGRYKIGRIAQTQQPHLTNSVIGDPTVHDQTWAEREDMVSFAGYPLIVDGRTIGVMAMFARHPLSETTLSAMASVANGIALGMERKRIEEELRRQTRLLKTVDQRKDEFLAMLAHELRNPLAPIRTGLEVLQLEGNDSETVVLIQQQVDHMVRLVDDLLDVSRILSGKIDLQKQHVQLSSVVSHALAIVQPFIEEHQHQLVVLQPRAPVWLDADSARLSQVLSNLLHNAIKYTPSGGRIELEARQHGDQIAVHIKDNGIGINPDFLPELFELFTQADRSLDRSSGGLGIGLTLVRRLVEQHGGSISASSVGVGHGSEFVVRLPLVEAPASAAPEAEGQTPVAEDAQPRCRILVVDDNVSSAKVMRRILGGRWHHDVELAYDGNAVGEVAQAFQPDIIFLDIGLPGKNGYEVARELRRQPAFTHTLLVALTGYGSAEDRRKSQAAGFDIHLVKPVTAKALRQVIMERTHS